jgi:hypothetical protein
VIGTTGAPTTRAQSTAGTTWRLGAGESRPPIGRLLFAFYAAVVLIQSVHVVEHVIQLIQVYLLGIADDDALGLLGYVFEFQGTEEWLHLGFNVLFLSGLCLIAFGLVRSRAARSTIPTVALGAFLFFGVWLEAWHVIEHAVIIANVIANNGCPCPGIVDAQLGVSDTSLHFVYNVITHVATTVPFLYLVRRGRRASRTDRAVAP